MNKTLKFNLQYFAEEENSNTQNTQLKTYTEEEYNKLKNSFDKTSKELAEMKKQEKEKLPEKEKEAQEREEMKKQLDDYKRQLENNKIEKLFLKHGFNSDDCEKIIKSRESEEFLPTILSVFATKLENEKKKWQEDLINKTKGINGGSSSEEESYAIKRAKNSNNKQEPIEWGSFKRR